MGRGHIKLGLPGETLKEYMLQSPLMHGYRKYLANPQAEKIGQGDRKYQDQQNWDYFVMTNWQAGVGQKDPDAGGFLYSEADTRFPEQVVLAPWPQMTSLKNRTNQSSLARGDTITLDNSGIQKVAILAEPTGTGQVQVVWVYIRTDFQAVVTMELYTESGGVPNTLIATTSTDSLEEEPSGRWMRFNFGSLQSAASNFFIVLSSTADTEFVTAPGDNFSLLYDGSSWSNSSSDKVEPMYVIREDGLAVSNSTGVRKLVTLDNTLYLFWDDKYSSWNNTTGVWAASSSVGNSGNVTDLALFRDEVWLAYGNSIDMESMDNANTFTTKIGIKADKLLVWNGYLWRSYSDNKVQYTADGSTWEPSTPIECGPPDYKITDMVGLEQDVIAITEDGMYRIVPGDWVFGIAPWGNIDEANGLESINWNGSVISPVGQDLMRYSSDGSIMSIGLNRREGLPQSKQGRVSTMLNMNNWLLGGVSPTEQAGDATIDMESGVVLEMEDDTDLTYPAFLVEGGYPSVWAWNVEGWHYMSKLLPETAVESLHFQRNSEIMWGILQDGNNMIPFRLFLPNDLTNPAKDNRTLYFSPYGWLETDWFDGRLLEILKDYESIYVAGENIDADKPVELYYMKGDETVWRKLGEATDITEELRWSDYSLRPVSYRIKFGMVLKSNDISATPVVNAYRVKYLAVVTDRYGWSLRIIVSENPEGVNGELITDTPATQRSFVETLERRTLPFIFEDLDSRQYEVRVLGAQEEIAHYEYLKDGTLRLDTVHNLTIEQIQTEEF